jgi:hypothetical protein
MKLGVALCSMFISMLALAAKEPAWKEFRSAADGFAAKFPGDPKLIEEKDQEFVIRRFTVRLDGRGFFVQSSDYGEPVPPGVVERLMGSTRDGLAEGLKGTVSEDRAVKCGAYPGRRFVITSPEGWFSVQMCVAGNRMYMAQANSRRTPIPKDAARFHDSLEIFPPPAK